MGCSTYVAPTASTLHTVVKNANEIFCIKNAYKLIVPSTKDGPFELVLTIREARILVAAHFPIGVMHVSIAATDTCGSF